MELIYWLAKGGKVQLRKNLSICMLSDDFLPAATGVGTHLQEVSKLLSRAGYLVSVVTTRRSGEPEIEIWEGVNVYRVNTIKLFGFYQAIPSLSTLRHILNNVAPDVVHYHYLGMMLLGGMKLAEELTLPQIYTYHMTEDHLTQPLPMRPLRKLIARQIVKICNRVDLVVSVSKGMANQLSGKEIQTPVRYISNPVSFPEEVRVELLPRTAPFIAMFAGRLNPEKNIPFLLRAFRGVVAQIPGALLWIAGHGSQKDHLQMLARELGIEQQVCFLGFLDHGTLSRYYASCDVFVLPSLVETQGLVAMEAMWFGKPIIVAKSVVSAAELVEEGGNGFIVDNESDSALTQRLLQLALDVGLQEKMGAVGKTMAKSYQPSIILAALQKAYTDVVDQFESRGGGLRKN